MKIISNRSYLIDSTLKILDISILASLVMYDISVLTKTSFEDLHIKVIEVER